MFSLFLFLTGWEFRVNSLHIDSGIFFFLVWGAGGGVVQWQGWCGDPVGEVPSNSHYGRICGEQVRGISGGGIGFSTL